MVQGANLAMFDATSNEQANSRTQRDRPTRATYGGATRGPARGHELTRRCPAELREDWRVATS
jgi:hypothetical protein